MFGIFNFVDCLSTIQNTYLELKCSFRKEKAFWKSNGFFMEMMISLPSLEIIISTFLNSVQKPMFGIFDFVDCSFTI